MFKYDKTVDQWSYEMVQDIVSMWGDPLIGQKPNEKLHCISFSSAFLDEILQMYGDEIISRLSLITGVKLELSDIHFFINTVRVSLHDGNKKFVSISLHHPLDSYITILIHELFHIFFHQFLYSDICCKSISEEKHIWLKNNENEVKEYITVIINDAFIDLIDIKDEGYPEHKKIRDEIFSVWCKNRSFIEILEYIKV